MVTRAIRGLPNVPALDDKALTDFLEDTRKVILQLRSEQIAGGSGSGAGSGGSGGSTGSGGSGGSTTPPYEPDLTPPPTPTGVVVSAGLDFVFMTTDAPIFSQGHGYGRTIVYGAKYSGSGPLPTFLDAVVVHEFVGQVGSFPTEPSTQWHIWLKWRSADGIESTTPAGGANGYTATTGVDISNLLIALTGAITTSELHSALSSRIDLIDGNGIGSVNERINTGDTALQTQITTLVASVAGNSAAIATEQSVRATADGFISAYYGLRTQVSQGGRTVVGGIGIMGTSGGTAGPTIDVGVVANKFYVTAPSGTTGVGDVVPFVIQTADEVVNGVSIPRGVYMDAAFIKNVQAITAKLGTLWVTDAMMVNVSADKLTTGSIAVGREIRSSDFVTGVSGWRLGGNHAEIGSSYIRGLLAAAQIDTRGLDIKDAAGNVILSSGGTLRLRGSNLIDPSWWRVGATFLWANNTQNGAVNDFVQATLPDGSTGVVMRATAGGGAGAEAGAGGGWDPNGHITDAFPIDNTKEYLFAVYIQVQTQGAVPGSAYWGALSTHVCDLNTTTPNANPYFAIGNRALMTLGRWYLFVGTVFPYGSTGNSNSLAGIYDCTTGEKIGGGNNWNWANITYFGGTRSYQYYSRGGVQYFARPQAWVCDGTQPSLSDLLSMAAPSARNQITASNVNSFLGAGAVAADRVTPAAGWLNSGITINANGTLSGAGAGQVTIAGIDNSVLRATNPITGGNVTTYISSEAIGDAQILNLAVDKLISGSIVGKTFIGGTFTGSVFQTATSGQRVTINESSSNEARFYGNRGDGTVELLASIGITSAGADNAVVKIGTSVSPYYGVHATSTIDAVVGHTYATSPIRAAVVGWSRATGGSAFAAGVVGQADGAGYGVYGTAASGAGVKGASTSGAGVFGISGSAAGVHGQSSTGYGGEFLGNATRSPVRLQTLYNSPPAAEDGAIAVLNTPQGYALCWAQGGSWHRMSGTVVPWNS